MIARPWPPGEPKPRDPLARATTGPDGTATLLLPAGRYALAAAHGGQSKAVAVTLDAAGRALLVLDGPGRLLTLVVEGAPPGAEVEAREEADGHPLAARSMADGRGCAALALRPGTYEVRAGARSLRVRVEGDARVRLGAMMVVANADDAASAPEK